MIERSVIKALRRGGLGSLVSFLSPVKVFYYFMFNLSLSVFRKLVRPNLRCILFCSYAGARFDDSPKAIYDFILTMYPENRFKLVWVFKKTGEYNLPKHVSQIRLNSLKFFYHSLKAGYIVSNATIHRKLNFVGRKTIYLNTWHGSALKKIGKDRKITSNNFCPTNTCIVDIMTAQSLFDIETFSRAFNIPKERFILTGLPRNDEISKYASVDISRIKEELSIPNDKKIILYAPTYRNWEYDEIQMEHFEDSPVHFSEWRQVLGDEYVILFRTHYYIAKILVENPDSDFVFDVSSYHSINNLIAVSDLLVSDYSSLFFDYSITEKPMLCFAYDLQKYSENVGLYMNLDEVFSNGIVTDEETLLNRIKKLDYKMERNHSRKIKKRFIESHGNATEKVVEYLLNFKK